MTRDEAVELVKSRVGNKNLVKHMLAVGVSMKFLAPHFDGNPVKWELAGILHDIDYDETKDDFAQHGILSYNELKKLGIDEDIASAVRAHPAHKDFPPQNSMEWALHIADPLTGLIVAATLMHPSKKIANLDTKFVLRRFKEKRFAAGANREQIELCENKLNLPLEEFIQIVLDAMKSISDEIGL
ncbi:HDIG domain-containing protein [bacterium]|nr:HDIG domain-containing protein [bacterium]